MFYDYFSFLFVVVHVIFLPLTSYHTTKITARRKRRTKNRVRFNSTMKEKLFHCFFFLFLCSALQRKWFSKWIEYYTINKYVFFLFRSPCCCCYFNANYYRLYSFCMHENSLFFPSSAYKLLNWPVLSRLFTRIM